MATRSMTQEPSKQAAPDETSGYAGPTHPVLLLLSQAFEHPRPGINYPSPEVSKTGLVITLSAVIG